MARGTVEWQRIAAESAAERERARVAVAVEAAADAQTARDAADLEAKLNELRGLRYVAALDMPELAAVPTNELQPMWAAAAEQAAGAPAQFRGEVQKKVFVDLLQTGAQQSVKCCICQDDFPLTETIGCSGPEGHATCRECVSGYVATNVEPGGDFYRVRTTTIPN